MVADTLASRRSLDEDDGKGTDGGGSGLCRSEMGVRSILIKIVFFIRSFPFHAGLGPLLMAARLGRRSAAVAAEREVKRARCHASEAVGSGRATSGVQGQDREGDVQECRGGSQASASTNSSGHLRSGLLESESARRVRGGDSRELLTAAGCGSEESKADQEWQEEKPSQ